MIFYSVFLFLVLAATQLVRCRPVVPPSRTIQLLLVADKSVVSFYKADDLDLYLLTLMNAVGTLIRELIPENPLRLNIVRLIILDPADPSVVTKFGRTSFTTNSSNQSADKMLENFCHWQAAQNTHDELDPLHHDLALLLTRDSLCRSRAAPSVPTQRGNSTSSSSPSGPRKRKKTRRNLPEPPPPQVIDDMSVQAESCNTLGLAEIAGLCQTRRSCALAQDTGLAVAYTIAHEIAHTMGATHDGLHNSCGGNHEGSQHGSEIMSPYLSSESLPTAGWSECTRQEVRDYLAGGWGDCLLEPSSVQYSSSSSPSIAVPEVESSYTGAGQSPHHYSYESVSPPPPGQVYDADRQCQLQYGHRNASWCLTGPEDNLCSVLWCRVPSEHSGSTQCITNLKGAAQGTPCGHQRWCQAGECVAIEESDSSNMAADEDEPEDEEWFYPPAEEHLLQRLMRHLGITLPASSGSPASGPHQVSNQTDQQINQTTAGSEQQLNIRIRNVLNVQNGAKNSSATSGA